MTLSTKIEVFLRILHLFAVGLHTCTAVARYLCVSWAFLSVQKVKGYAYGCAAQYSARAYAYTAKRTVAYHGSDSFRLAVDLLRTCCWLSIYRGLVVQHTTNPRQIKANGSQACVGGGPTSSLATLLVVSARGVDMSRIRSRTCTTVKRGFQPTQRT